LENPVTACLQLSIDAAPDNVRLVRRTVADAALEAGADADALGAIALAVDEAMTNAVRHAYDSGSGSVSVSVDLVDSLFAVVVRDEGRGFTTAEATREQEGGGYGLKLMKRLADDFIIVSVPDRGTELRMVFVLHGTSTGSAVRPTR
jgi:serine/threonine-protein kinase RsbW